MSLHPPLSFFSLSWHVTSLCPLLASLLITPVFPSAHFVFIRLVGAADCCVEGWLVSPGDSPKHCAHLDTLSLNECVAVRCVFDRKDKRETSMFSCAVLNPKHLVCKMLLCIVRLVFYVCECVFFYYPGCSVDVLNSSGSGGSAGRISPQSTPASKMQLAAAAPENKGFNKTEAFHLSEHLIMMLSHACFYMY